MIAKLDAEPAAPDHEELVFVFMMVPREFALNLHQFNLLAIYSGNRLRPPAFAEQREFVVQADFVHICRLVLSNNPSYRV
jgi:hypothetical protein